MHVPHVPDLLISNTRLQYEGVDMEENDGRDRGVEREHLEAVAGRVAGELDRDVEPVMLEGAVHEAIDAYAAPFDTPGVIVMATHGRTGLGRAWIGSVSDAVVRFAPWPVLLIRAGTDGNPSLETGFRRVMVPLDGSARSERILPHAIEIARDAAGTLELLQVMTPTSAGGAMIFPVSEAALAEASRRAHRCLAEMTKRLRQRETEVEFRIIEHSRPARPILEVIEEDRPDLVAMSTHGYRGVTRFIFGSVADEVLRGGTTPLLLLGPGVHA